MAQVVDVNGELVEFPDNMSREQIADVLKQHYPSSERKPAPSSFVKGVLDPFQGTATLIGKGLSKIGIGYGDDLANFYLNLEKEFDKARQEGTQFDWSTKQYVPADDGGMDWARVVGNVASPANALALSRFGLASKAPETVKAIGTGAIAGAMSPTQGEDFASEKTQQVALGAALGPVGEVVTSRAGRVLSPNISKEEALVRSMGISPTPGQAIGGQPKAWEDFAQNIPVVGAGIREAKDKSIIQLNRGIMNRALKKVDKELPEGLVGNEAVEFLYQTKNEAYAEVLPKLLFNLDLKDKGKLRNLVANSNLTDKNEIADVDNILRVIVFNKFPEGVGRISGTTYKEMESELKGEIANLYRGSASDVRKARALEKTSEYLRTSLSNQNKELTPQLRRADALDRDYRVISMAASNSGAEGGIFSPKQYQQAVREADATRKKTSFARGKANGQDVAKAGLEILGEEADSILQGRVGSQVAGGIAIGTNPALAAAIGAAIKTGYSPVGLKVLDAMIAKRPQFAITLGELVKAKSGNLGGLSAQEIVEAYNRSEKLPQSP